MAKVNEESIRGHPRGDNLIQRLDCRIGRIREPISDEAFSRAIKVMPPMLADVVTLQRYTALRPGELCRMKWRDISREDASCWVCIPPEHKTAYQGQRRLIPLGRLCKAILMKYRNRPADAPIFSPRETEHKRPAELHERRVTPLTPSQSKRAARAMARSTTRTRAPGSGWRADSYRRAMQRCLETAGLARWFPRLLRHTRGTEARGSA